MRSRGVEGLGLAAPVIAQVEVPSFVMLDSLLVDVCARSRNYLYCCFGEDLIREAVRSLETR